MREKNTANFIKMQEKWLVYFYLRNMTLFEFIAMDEMEQQEAIWAGKLGQPNIPGLN